MPNTAHRENILLRAVANCLYPHTPIKPRVVHLRSGKSPFAEMESDAFVIFPTTAVVASQSSWPDGYAEQHLMIGYDGVVGRLKLFLGPLVEYRFTVLQEGSALALPANEYATLRQAESFRNNLLKYLNHVVQASITTPHCLSHHNATQRIARWMLSVDLRSPLREIAIRHATLAELLGLRRESITEALAMLRSDGAISSSRNSLQILDRTALLTHTCNCFDADRAWLECLDQKILPPPPRARNYRAPGGDR